MTERDDEDMTRNKRDFARDRAVCEAATPGPWIARAWTVATNDQFNVGTEDADLATFWQGKRYAGSREVSAEEARSNTVFAAEAREGWPAALDEIERLQAENQALANVGLANHDRIVALEADVQRLRAALEKASIFISEAVNARIDDFYFLRKDAPTILAVLQSAISTTTEPKGANPNE